MDRPLYQTDIPDFPVHRGKVRDVYDLQNGTLVVVATDRVSTFDAVHPTPIPDKGRVLTEMTLLWLDVLPQRVRGLTHHLLSADPRDYGSGLDRYRDQLEGRSMLVQKAEERVDAECVVRGYLAGSGWKDYQNNRKICGIELPEGLQESSKLPRTIFTPTTKADVGHDMPMTFEELETLVGVETAAQLKQLSVDVYETAAGIAEEADLIVADTKFEWGRKRKGDKQLMLIDEVLTPDSSRFWPKNTYKPGGPQPSFDKQYVRDFAAGTGWNKQPPAPELPEEIVLKTRDKYLEALRRLRAVLKPV